MRAHLHSAFHSLRRKPAFLALAALALAAGTGATITLFSLVHAVFIQPLPYPDADRLVWLRERHADIPARPVSYPNFRDWQARNESFEAMAAVRDVQRTLTGRGVARTLDVAVVTADYFRVIGVPPELGRNFTESEDIFGAAPVAIVSHRLWQDALGTDIDPIGTNLTLNDTSYSIVGVTPPNLSLPGDPDAWILMGQLAASDTGWTDRSNRLAGFVVGRLLPGVALDEARADLTRIHTQLARDYPLHIADNEVELLMLDEALNGNLRAPLLLSLGAVGVLLLIVCVNLSNLLLIRAIGRRSEFALRTALGARPGTLFTQSMTESVVLALLGAGLGAVAAIFGTQLLAWWLSGQLFHGTTIAVGWPIIGFAAGLAMLLGLGMGAVPAWKSASSEPQPALNDGAKTTGPPTSGRARNAFLLFQTSLAVVLLVCAALLVGSLFRLLASEPGFEKEGVLTFNLALPNRYQGAALSRLYTRLETELGALPGVSAAALTNQLPGLPPSWQTDIAPQVREELRNAGPGGLINVDWGIVSADYFETMRIPITRGRAFTAEEAEQGAPVVIVDESLANRFWPDGDAVGGRLAYDGPEPVEIVGVAANVHTYGREEAGLITLYTAYGRFPYMRNVTATMRANGIDPLSLVAPARAAIRGIDLDIAVDNVATLDQRLAERVAPRALTTRIITLFASFAALLSALGIYSTVSYVLAERRRDLGLRMALGAAPRDIVALVMRSGLLVSASGIAIGLIAALGASRLLTPMLFGLGPASPAVYAFIAVSSFAAAALACTIPAWRASRIDPVAALRA